MSEVATTLTDLARIYDKTIALLEQKLDAGTITGTELSELRKLLDAGQILSLVRAAQDAPKAPNAVGLKDLPFVPTEGFRITSV